MEKRILSLLLALVMLLSLCPVTALATETDLTRPEQQEEVPAASENEAVEKVVSAAPPRLLGDGPTPASWTELRYALNGTTTETIPGLFEISGSTIKLLADFTAEEGDTTLYVSGEKTLDLNGHVIDGNKIVDTVIEVGAGASLTLEDSRSATKHKFSTATDCWVLDEYNGNYTVTGGVITGGSATNGGGVNVVGKFAMGGGNIIGNTATSGGGVYISSNENATFAMEGGTITGNTATSGGGVYAYVEECLAAGTPITLADGTRTAIENLKKGDMVRVFDHETGKISSARLFDLWKYPAKQSGAFTLHFTNGIDVTAVGGHCFFDRAEKQYAAINIENVNDYIGHEFYNADDGRWETLTGVTFLTEAVDTYIIVSEKHLNVVAGGMLSNEDGIYTLMCNVFAFGENLTIDAAAKAEDIAQYGLWDYANMQYFSRYAYDALNLQYMSVLFGRGILTPEEFAELEAYSAEIDPELYCSGKEAETTLPQKAEAKESLLTKIVSFLTAPFVKTAHAADLKKLGPGVYFGGTAYVVGNKANTEANTEENNVFMSLTRIITLGNGDNGDNGVIEPEETMRVGVTLADGGGTFTGMAAAADTAYFFSDDPVYAVQYVPNHLELVKSWTELQKALNGTTTDTIPGLFEINDNTITLTANFKAEEGNTTLRVSGTKTLDLNGYVIDAAGKLPVENGGSVITVESGASLTLKDSKPTTEHYFTVGDDGLWTLTDTKTETTKTVKGGVITGGKADNGGGVFVKGIFNMDGGNITGNKAKTTGGGVNVPIDTGSFTMSGNSKITDNIAQNGGGVFISYRDFTMTGGEISNNTATANYGGVFFNGTTLTLGDTAKITGNKKGTGENAVTQNLYLSKGKTITLGTGDSAPKSGMSVGVTMQTAGQFTAAASGANAAKDCFTSDDADYAVRYDNSTTDDKTDDFLKLVKVYAITNGTPESGKDTTNGYLIIDKTSAAVGDTVTITVTPNSGYRLKADSLKVYKTGESTTTVNTSGSGNTYTFTMPAYAVTVTAEFEVIPKTTVTINAAAEGFTYGEAGKKGYKSVSVANNLVTATDLVATYYKETATVGTYEETGSTTVPKDAGNYKVVLSVPETNENYTGSKELTFTIAKRPVTLVAGSANKVYDGYPLTCTTFTVKENKTTPNYGFVNDEGVSSVAMTPESAISDVGSVDNVIGTPTAKNGTNLNNYVITTENGTLTVTPASMTVTATGYEGFYDGVEHLFEIKEGDKVTLGGISYVVTNAAGEEITDATITIREKGKEDWLPVTDFAPYKDCFRENSETKQPEPIDLTLEIKAEKTGFAVATCETTIKIKPRPVTLVAGSKSKIYDGKPLTCNDFAVKEDTTTAGYGFIKDEGVASVTMTEGSTITNVGNVFNVIDKSKITAKDGTTLSNYDISTENGTLTVTKADMAVGTNILAPSVPIPLVYDRSAKELLCAGQTWDEKDGTTSFGTFYYSVDGENWSTDLPTAVNAGEYEPVWYFVGDKNHNNIGSAEEPIEQLYPIEISKGDQTSATVTMENYTYGGTLPEPSISIIPADNAVVTYYASATNATTGGNEWKNMTATTLDAGTYYMYAVIAETDNFSSQTTAAVAFTVAKADVAKPAAGVGYTVDYVNETITPVTGYEVSIANDFKTVLSTETDITFGTIYYVRKAEDNNHNASEGTFFSFTRPAAPAASAFTMTGETVENKKDGSFSGITAAMEYSTDNGTTWAPGPKTLTGLSNETVKVRYKATTAAFKSSEYSYTFEVSTAKLTVNINGTETQIAYGKKLSRPDPNPTKSGYTFGGWYSDEELTQAWNFDVDTVKDDMNLYPKWIRNYVPITTISGKVTQGDTAVSDATVELYLGTEKVAATVTGWDGSYVFDKVEKGTYNIVVTKGDKTKTELVTVDSTGSFSANVELPTKAVSSKVEHKGNEVPNTKSDINETVVGGLDIIAAAETPTAGQTITIKLTVEPKADTDTRAQTSIKNLPEASGKKVEFLDLSLWKITTTTQGELKGDIGDSNTQLLTIVIPFDFSGVNVSSVMILRQHGTDNAEKLTKNPVTGQEGYVVDTQAGTITLYAMKFSDYAVAYSNASHGGGSYTPGHTVTSDLNNVTKVTIDGKVVDSKYYTVSGGTVYFTGEFMKTLANGKHTVKLYDGLKVATGTITVTGNMNVVSAATGDAGLALYAALSVSSVLGMGWVGKKKRDEE